MGGKRGIGGVPLDSWWISEHRIFCCRWFPRILPRWSFVLRWIDWKFDDLKSGNVLIGGFACDCLVDWLVYCLVDSLVDWLVDLVDWLDWLVVLGFVLCGRVVWPCWGVVSQTFWIYITSDAKELLEHPMTTTAEFHSGILQHWPDRIFDPGKDEKWWKQTRISLGGKSRTSKDFFKKHNKKHTYHEYEFWKKSYSAFDCSFFMLLPTGKGFWKYH